MSGSGYDLGSLDDDAASWLMKLFVKSTPQAGSDVLDCTTDMWGNQGNQPGRYRGVIKKYFENEGYGFIECPDTMAMYGTDIYINRLNMGLFQRGDDVIFSVDLNKDGKPQGKDLEPASLEAKKRQLQAATNPNWSLNQQSNPMRHERSGHTPLNNRKRGYDQLGGDDLLSSWMGGNNDMHQNNRGHNNSSSSSSSSWDAWGSGGLGGSNNNNSMGGNNNNGSNSSWGDLWGGGGGSQQNNNQNHNNSNNNSSSSDNWAVELLGDLMGSKETAPPSQPDNSWLDALGGYDGLFENPAKRFKPEFQGGNKGGMDMLNSWNKGGKGGGNGVNYADNVLELMLGGKDKNRNGMHGGKGMGGERPMGNGYIGSGGGKGGGMHHGGGFGAPGKPPAVGGVLDQVRSGGKNPLLPKGLGKQGWKGAKRTEGIPVRPLPPPERSEGILPPPPRTRTAPSLAAGDSARKPSPRVVPCLFSDSRNPNSPENPVNNKREVPLVMPNTSSSSSTAETGLAPNSGHNSTSDSQKNDDSPITRGGLDGLVLAPVSGNGNPAGTVTAAATVRSVASRSLEMGEKKPVGEKKREIPTATIEAMLGTGPSAPAAEGNEAAEPASDAAEPSMPQEAAEPASESAAPEEKTEKQATASFYGDLFASLPPKLETKAEQKSAEVKAEDDAAATEVAVGKEDAEL